MKNLKKTVAIGMMILAMCATSLTAFAASQYGTPAEAVAGITGRTIDSVVTERNETGKTYGAIADEAGKLDEFKAENLELKKDKLDTQVAAGTITQEKADSIIAAIKENHVNCDGTGKEQVDRNMGAKFGANGAVGAKRGSGMGTTILDQKDVFYEWSPGRVDEKIRQRTAV